MFWKKRSDDEILYVVRANFSDVKREIMELKQKNEKIEHMLNEIYNHLFQNEKMRVVK